MKRYSRTVAQQCRYYEVNNIFEYMVETYLNGNITTFGELYRELCKEARKDFIDFLLSVTFETVICAWDEKIPALLIRLVNTLLFCRTEEELRQSIDKLRETTELDEFFTYGYGSHHFWCNQRISKGSVQFIQSRLFIATF